jgi:hypothetical protein
MQKRSRHFSGDRSARIDAFPMEEKQFSHLNGDNLSARAQPAKHRRKEPLD